MERTGGGGLKGPLSNFALPTAVFNASVTPLSGLDGSCFAPRSTDSPGTVRR